MPKTIRSRREHLPAQLGQRVDLEQVVEHPDPQIRAPAISTIPASRKTNGPRVERTAAHTGHDVLRTRPPSRPGHRVRIGRACTCRSRYLATAPVRSAISRATTVSRRSPMRRRGKRTYFPALGAQPSSSRTRRAARDRVEHLGERAPRRSTRPWDPCDVDDRGGQRPRTVRVQRAASTSPRRRRRASPRLVGVGGRRQAGCGSPSSRHAGRPLRSPRGRSRGRASAPPLFRGCRRGPTQGRCW